MRYYITAILLVTLLVSSCSLQGTNDSLKSESISTHSDSYNTGNALLAVPMTLPNKEDAGITPPMNVQIQDIASNNSLQTPVRSTHSNTAISVLHPERSKKLNPKLQQEYNTLLQEISDSHKAGGTYNWKNSDSMVLRTHLELLRGLYKASVLPQVGNISFNKNRYDIISTFATEGFLPPELYWDKKVSIGACGRVSAPGGTYDPPCVLIRVTDGAVFVPENIGPPSDWNGDPAYFEIEGGYLLSLSSDGDGCVGLESYMLFDQDLMYVSGINGIYTGCGEDNSTLRFSKNSSFIEFSGLIPEPSMKKDIQERSFNSVLYGKDSNFPEAATIVQKTQYSSGSRYQLDIAKNILNKDLFEFSVNEEFIQKDPSKELESIQLSSTGNLIFTVIKVEQGFEIIGQPRRYKPLKSIKILSCKNNSTEHDSEWYEPKLENTTTGEFIYRINPKFGNSCDIPYIFRTADESGYEMEQSITIEKNKDSSSPKLSRVQ